MGQVQNGYPYMKSRSSSQKKKQRRGVQIPQIGKFSARKNFCQSPSTTKIKPTNYFLRCIIGVNLYCRVVIVTKIRPGENLTDEIFYQRKFPIYGSLQTTSLCYSIAKPALYVLLAFNKVEKPNMKISILFIFFLSSSSSHIIYGICECYTQQAIALLMEIIPT